MEEQCALSRKSDAGYAVKRGIANCPGALIPMKPDGKTVGFVAEALEIVQERILLFELEGRPAGKKELFASRVSILSLGDSDDRQVFDIERPKHFLGDGKLSGTAVNEKQIGTVGLFRFGESPESPGQHFAHHIEVITLDVCEGEFSICLFVETLDVRDNHRADGLAALDVGIVENFDAARRRGKAEAFGEFFQQGISIGIAHKIASEGFLRVFPDLQDEFTFLPPLRRCDFNAVAAVLRQGFLQKFLSGNGLVEQDEFRRRAVVIKLREKSLENFGAALFGAVSWKIFAVAPVLTGSKEKDFNAHASGVFDGGKDIRFVDVARMNPLPRLYTRKRGKAVARECGAFIVKGFGLPLHLLHEGFLELS